MLIQHHDRNDWAAVLSHCKPHDIYHTWQYHQVAKGTAIPKLLVYQSNDHMLALPGLFSGNRLDSVYGYPGLITTPNPIVDLRSVWAHFDDDMLALGVTTLVTRTNPLIPKSGTVESLAGLFTREDRGQTTYLDLTQPLRPSKGHKTDLKKASAALTVRHDPDFTYLRWLALAYAETMSAVSAAPAYHWDLDYFSELLFYLRDHIHVFVAFHGPTPVSAALFFEYQGLCQYHISATPNRDHLPLGGAKLIIQEAYEFFKARGNRVLHLGGGLGGDTRSPLFRMKAGFGGPRVPYYIAKWERR